MRRLRTSAASRPISAPTFTICSELALKDERVDQCTCSRTASRPAESTPLPPTLSARSAPSTGLRSAKIHCIAFATEANFLKELAEKNGGDFRLVDGKPEKEPAPAEKPKA